MDKYKEQWLNYKQYVVDQIKKAPNESEKERYYADLLAISECELVVERRENEATLRIYGNIGNGGILRSSNPGK